MTQFCFNLPLAWPASAITKVLPIGSRLPCLASGLLDIHGLGMISPRDRRDAVTSSVNFSAVYSHMTVHQVCRWWRAR